MNTVIGENYFNIIRELYLNKENRNILNEFIKYMNRSAIWFLMYSTQDMTSLCHNCFKDENRSEISCSNLHLFCEKCNLEHLDKYSKFYDYHTINGYIELVYKHECDMSIGPIGIHFDIYQKVFLDECTTSFKSDAKPSIIFHKKFN